MTEEIKKTNHLEIDTTEVYKPISSSIIDILENKKNIEKRESKYKGTEYYIKGKDVVITGIRQDDNLKLTLKDSKLLDYLMIEIIKTNKKNSKNINCDISFSLQEYMNFTGRKKTKSNIDNCRIEIYKSIEVLYNLDFKIDNNGTEINTRMLQQTVRNSSKGEFKVLFTKPFIQHIISRPLTQYNTRCFSLGGIGDSKGNRFYLFKKLQQHYTMNNNIRNNTNNILKIKNILSYIPNIKNYEDVKKLDGNVKRRIKKPLEKALQELQEENFIKYYYCKGDKQNRTRLSFDQVLNIKFKEYENIYISFELSDKPPKPKDT